MVNHNRNGLPKNWRQQVAETLSTKGFQVNPQKVYNSLRGKVKDDILLAEIKAAIKDLRSQHHGKTKRIRALLRTR